MTYWSRCCFPIREDHTRGVHLSLRFRGFDFMHVVEVLRT